MASTVASRRVLRLQEYGSPSDFHLSKQELENLATANSRWSSALGLSSPPLRIELTETGARLRAEGVTGVVRVGGIDIEIAPKFLDPSSPNWQSALWRILAVAEGGGIVGSLTSGTPDNIEGLPDVLADVFLESFRRGSTRGFPNGYRTVNSSGTVVRGSFDTSRISEWLAAPWRTPFITDQLVEDTPLSRIVRWTARVLSSSVSSHDRSKALNYIYGSLSHIGDTPPSLYEARRLKISAQYRALEPAVTIGILLMEGAGLEHGGGTFHIPGFLWNSDVVYEKFLFRMCQLAGVNHGLTVGKESYYFGDLVFGEGPQLQTIPDIVFRDHHHNVVAIADSKYKKLGDRPKSNDSYQIITAAHVLGSSKIALLFPSDGLLERRKWRIQSKLGADDIYLSALPIDLMLMRNPTGANDIQRHISAWLDEVETLPRRL